MLNRYRGCLMGAAIGDAFGMPYESLPRRASLPEERYCRAPRRHPNETLPAGSFTEDTQVMLIAGELLAEGGYSHKAYASRLRDEFLAGRLRYPDGTIFAACERLASDAQGPSGIESDTAGCLSLSVPFALAFPDPVERRDPLRGACAVTHRHPAVSAAAVSFSTLLAETIHDENDPFTSARRAASLDYTDLGHRISEALDLADEGISLDAALSALGSGASVFQTYPLALFLIARFGEEDTLLSQAAGVGGNTDTISLICGAWLGASMGTGGFSSDLVVCLEERERIEECAEALYALGPGKD